VMMEKIPYAGTVAECRSPFDVSDDRAWPKHKTALLGSKNIIAPKLPKRSTVSN